MLTDNIVKAIFHAIEVSRFGEVLETLDEVERCEIEEVVREAVAGEVAKLGAEVVEALKRGPS